jgi:thioredoxin-dependent peroxiredoxin
MRPYGKTDCRLFILVFYTLLKSHRLIRKNNLMPAKTHLEVGKSAPKFTVPGYPDAKYRLSEALKEGPVVLYFYPRDDTPGCTKEACGFQESLSRFKKLKATIFGVSTDDVASHEKFAAKYELNFPLLADTDHAICEKYGVWVEKNMYGKKSMGIQRATFLIGADGKLAQIWPKVKVDGHIDEVAEAVNNLK